MPSDYRTRRSALYNALKNGNVEGLPESEEEFIRKLDDPEKRSRLYDALKVGNVDGLPDKQTWETRLSQTGNPKPITQDQYTFSGEQLGIETPTSAPTIGGVNAEPNFDWNTGQWNFQKEQKGEPIAFGANAPNADTSIADMAGERRKQETPQGVRDTGLRSGEMTEVPEQQFRFATRRDTETDRRRKMQEEYEKEQGIRKEMMLQGLDPDDEEDRRTFDEEPEREAENWLQGEIERRENAGPIERGWERTQQEAELAQREEERRNKPIDPENPLSMSVGQWEDRINGSVNETVEQFSGDMAKNVADMANRAGVRTFNELNRSNLYNNLSQPGGSATGSLVANPTTTAVRGANEARSNVFGDAVSDELVAQMRGEYSDAMKGLIDSKEFQDRITKEAERLGYDKAYYETKVLQRMTNEYLAGVREAMIRQNMPESDADWFINNIFTGVTGSLVANAYKDSDTYKAGQEALQLYAQEHDLGVVPQVGGMVLSMAPDAWLFRGTGALAGRMVGGGMGALRGMRAARVAARTGSSSAQLERATEAYLNSNFGARVAERTLPSMLQSGMTLGTYEGLSTAVNQANAGYFDPMEILKQTGHGAVFGSVLGTMSGVGNEVGNRILGSATAKSSNIARVLKSGAAEAAKYGTEATAFTMGEQIGQLVMGEDLKPWDEAVASGVVTPLMFKISTGAGIRELRKAYDYAFRPERYDRENYQGVSFTKEEQRQIRESVNARNFFDALSRIEKMYGRDITPEERGRTMMDANYNALRSELDWNYTQLMNDPEVDYVTKQKLAVVGGGLLAVRMPAATYVERTWNDETGQGEVITRDADGRRIETRTFTNEGKMERYANEQERVVRAEEEAAASNIELEPTSWNETYRDMRRRGMTYEQLQESQERIGRYAQLQNVYRQARDGAQALEQRLETERLSAEEEEQIRETIGMNEAVADRAREAMDAMRDELTEQDKAVMQRWAQYTLERKGRIYDRMKAIEGDVEDRTNADMGEVVYATMKQGGEKVNVVAGRVVSDGDGSVNVRESDDSLIVMDADGNKRMVSPSDLEKVDDNVEPLEVIENAQREVENDVDSELERDASVPSGETPAETPAEEPTEEGEAPATVTEERGEGEFVDGETVWLDLSGDGELTDYIVSVEEDGTVTLHPADGVGEDIIGSPDFISKMIKARGERKTEKKEETSAEEINPAKRPHDYVKAKGGWEKMMGEENGVDITYDAVLEMCEGSEQRALAVLNGMLQQAEGALKKVRSSQRRLTGEPEEMAQQAKDNEGRLSVAQNWVDFLKKAIDVPRRRAADAELDRINEQRKQEQKAKAEAEQKRKEAEEKAKRDAEAVKGVPDWTDDTPQDAQKRGFIRVDGQRVDRQGKIETIDGKEATVAFTKAKAPEKGRVVLANVEDIQQSHRQGVENPLHYFLRDAQPKNDEREDVDSQMSAQQLAEELDMVRITNLGEAYSGPPSINARGEVIQGNNRVDAFKYMYENMPEKAEEYIQYLKDHASDYGLTAEDVDRIEHPVMVMKLDVTDPKAEELGKYTRADLESGGREGIDAKTTMSKLSENGDDAEKFVRRLLDSDTDDASITELVRKNGVEALKMLQERGHINNAQYRTALNSKGELKDDAVTALKNVLYEMIFQGGGTSLREKYDKLPSKAQKALLATMYRDFSSAKGDRMLPEVQKAIEAYYELSLEPDFAEATTPRDVHTAVQTWKGQLKFDENGEVYQPASKYSDFAIRLAEMMKTETQTFQQKCYNTMFDIIQGVNNDMFFTEESLDERVQQILQAYRDGKERKGDVGSNNVDVNAGGQGSPEVPQEGGSPEGGVGPGTPGASNGEVAPQEETPTPPQGGNEPAPQEPTTPQENAPEVSAEVVPNATTADKVAEAEKVYDWGEYSEKSAKKDLDEIASKLKKDLGLKKVTKAEFMQSAGALSSVHFMASLDDENHKGIGVSIRMGQREPERITVEVANDFQYALKNNLPSTLGRSEKEIKDNKFSYEDVKDEVEKALRDAATGGNNVKEWINSILSPQEKKANPRIAEIDAEIAELEKQINDGRGTLDMFEQAELRNRVIKLQEEKKKLQTIEEVNNLEEERKKKAQTKQEDGKKAHDERLASVQGKGKTALGVMPLYDAKGEMTPQERLKKTHAEAVKDARTLANRLREALGIKSEDVERERKRGNCVVMALTKQFRAPSKEGEYSSGMIVIRLPLNQNKDRAVVQLTYDIDSDGRLFFKDARAFRSIDDNTVGERTRLDEPTYESVLETLRSKLDKEETPAPQTEEVKTPAEDKQYDWDSKPFKQIDSEFREIVKRVASRFGIPEDGLEFSAEESPDGSGLLTAYGDLPNGKALKIDSLLANEGRKKGEYGAFSLRVSLDGKEVNIPQKGTKGVNFKYGDVEDLLYKLVEPAEKNAQEWPLMSQYAKLKEKFPGAILLFRAGDYYEVFGEDAKKVGDVLGISVTNPTGQVEQAGFEYKAIDTYLPKLIRAGHKVVICDQLEDPGKLTERLTQRVKKGITELIAPKKEEKAETATGNGAPVPQVAKPTYGLSDEMDENDHPFVRAADGSTTFGEIGEETGLPSAPIKLSEGVITNPETNAGYGLVHIEARHGAQIRKAGYKDVVSFIQDVAHNYERIRLGNKYGNKQSYILELSDELGNTLIVELSRDKGYWNINTAGIFNKGYLERKKEVFSRPAAATQPTTTGEVTQSAARNGSEATETSKDNTSNTSEGKDNNNFGTTKENGEKNEKKLLKRETVQGVQDVAQRNDGAKLSEAQVKKLGLASVLDKGKYALNFNKGVYFEGGYAYATDGKQLMRVKMDYPKEYEGQLVVPKTKEKLEAYERGNQWEKVISEALTAPKGEFTEIDKGQLKKEYEAAKVIADGLKNVLGGVDVLVDIDNTYDTKGLYAGFGKMPISSEHLGHIMDILAHDKDAKVWTNGEMLVASGKGVTYLAMGKDPRDAGGLYNLGHTIRIKDGKIEFTARDRSELANERREVQEKLDGLKPDYSKVDDINNTFEGILDDARKVLTKTYQERANITADEWWDVRSALEKVLKVGSPTFTEYEIEDARRALKKLGEAEKKRDADIAEARKKADAKYRAQKRELERQKAAWDKVSDMLVEEDAEKVEQTKGKLEAWTKNIVNTIMRDCGLRWFATGEPRTTVIENREFGEIGTETLVPMNDGHDMRIRVSVRLKADGSAGYVNGEMVLYHNDMQASAPFYFDRSWTAGDLAENGRAEVMKMTEDIGVAKEEYEKQMEQWRKDAEKAGGAPNSGLLFRGGESENESGRELSLFSEREAEGTENEEGMAERGPVVGREAVENTIRSLEGRLGHKIRRIEDKSEVRNRQALASINRDERNGEKRTKGWYDPRTGEMVIYMPNCTGARDAAATVLHEMKGHKGLRSLLGEQFEQTMRDIYRMLPNDVRKQIRQKALDKEWTIEVATEEHLAKKAESDEKRPNWWRRVLARIKEALRKLGFNVKFTDADINYLLWKAEDKLRAEGKGVFDRAEDINRRSQAEREAREERRQNAESVLSKVKGQKAIGGIRGEEGPTLPDIDMDESEPLVARGDDGDARFRVGNKRRAEMERRLDKRRPDLSQEEKEALFDYLDTLDDTKLENATFDWFVKGTIRLPEDMDKVRQAVEVAGKAKVDPAKYGSPMELLNTHADFKPTKPRINPDDVPTLTNKKDYGNGITVYDVDESEESRKNMRAIIDTHWGEDANPWCLLAKNPKTGEFYPDSEGYWNDTYNAYGKKVAFKDGKLLAFFASDGQPTWWDRNDRAHAGIPVTGKMRGDKEGRSATYEYKIPAGDIVGLDDMYDLVEEDATGDFDRDWKSNYGEGGWSEPTNMHRGNMENGTYEEWYDNGQKKQESHWKDGEQVGEYKTWYETGVLRNKSNFNEDGYLDGISEGYNVHGNLTERTEYSDGEMAYVENFYPNGQLKLEASYDINSKNTRNNRLWRKEYYKVGQLKENDYWGEDGLYHVEEYYENGQKKLEEKYNVSRDRVGEWTKWYGNGQVESIQRYNNKGELSGEHVKYHEDGRLRFREFYKDGKREGLQERWGIDNYIVERVNYKNGRKEGVEEQYFRHDIFHPEREVPNVVRERTEYKDGKENGISEKFYSNGRLSNYAELRDGQANGACVNWGSDGQLIDYSEYKDGSSDGFFAMPTPTKAEPYDYCEIRDGYRVRTIPAEEGEKMLSERLKAVEEKIAKANERFEDEGLNLLFRMGENRNDKGYTLSDIRSEEGGRFFQNKDGDIDLATLPQEVCEAIGIPAFPFRATQNAIYHAFKNHGKQVGARTPSEMVAFAVRIINNFDHVRKGDGENSFIFSIENRNSPIGKRAITLVVNSDNGDYLRLKTSGNERIDRLQKRELLWEKSEPSTAGTVPANVTSMTSRQDGGTPSNASNQSISSDGKGNNNFGNSKENGENLRFREVEEETRTLVGVHNISEEKLRKGIRLGGSVNPSIAVYDTAKDYKHTGYGEISFIVPSEMMDEATTYIGDAYTGTVPTPIYHPSKEGRERMSKDIMSVPAKAQEMVHRGIDLWLDNSGRDNAYLPYLFLREKGIEPESIEGYLRYPNASATNILKEYPNGYRLGEYLDENGLSDEYRQWLGGLMDRYGVKEMYYDGTDSRGAQKFVPATLENATRIMNKEVKENGGSAGVVSGNIAAAVLKKMTSRDEIRAQRGRMTGDEDGAIKKFDDKWGPVVDELTRALTNNPNAQFNWLGEDRLEEALHQRNPRKYIKNEYGIELSDDLAKKLDDFISACENDRPAKYFEAKMPRGVKWNEFAAMVAPDDLADDIREYFEGQGVPIVYYKHGNKADREMAMQEAMQGEGILFREAEEETPSRPSGPLRPGEGIFDRAEAVSRDYMAELERVRKSREEAKAERPKEEREYIQAQEVKRRVDAVLEKLKNITAEHKQDEELTRRAVKALNGEMLAIRRAMTLQKNYDANTVKRIRHLANMMMETGLIEPQGRAEVKELLRSVTNAIEGATTGSGKRWKRTVDDLWDFMVRSQLRKSEAELKKRLGVKGFTTKAAGGKLGPKKEKGLEDRGIALLNTMRDALKLNYGIDDIEQKKYEYLEQMATDETAEAKYEAMCLMEDWQEKVQDLQKAEKDMEAELEEARKSGQLKGKEWDEYEDSMRQAIRETKMERAKNLTDLTSRLNALLQESAKKVAEKREKDAAHVKELYEDMFGDNKRNGVDLPDGVHIRDSWKQRFVNNPIVRAITASLPNFDMVMRMYGHNNPYGKGRLWTRFMGEQLEATQREYESIRDNTREMDKKVEELWGRKGMRWSDLYVQSRKKSGIDVTIRNGSKEEKADLTIGNALYVYMVEKMTDGRTKLRRMGITSEDVERIKEKLDEINPRWTQLADWAQDEFFPKTREEYNKVHKEVFGVSMEDIPNYVPLRINRNAIHEDVDMTKVNTQDRLPATMTGSVIQRTRNSLPIDILRTDGVGVVAGHVKEMGHWMAFAQMNKDLCTMLSSKKFRAQTLNMVTPYGGGQKLWNTVKEACIIASGAYQSDASDFEKGLVNLAKGATAAAITFRSYTAFKQLASAPAFLASADFGRLLNYYFNPVAAKKSWDWCMKELPMFEKRWKSRIAGETRLRPSDSDWGWWKNTMFEKLSKWGMFPNALVDCHTVACGARATYDKSYNKYLKQGFDKETADRKAKQDAVVAFNESQQSAENAFNAAMQLSESWYAVTMSTFKNAPFSYGRQVMQSMMNLAKYREKGYKETAIAEMTRQNIKDGLDEEQARRAAEKEYESSKVNNVLRGAIFGWGLPAIWFLVSQAPLLASMWINGGGDDEDDELAKDLIVNGVLGNIQGFVGGKELSDALTTDWSRNGRMGGAFLPDLPFAQRAGKVITEAVDIYHGNSGEVDYLVKDIAELALMSLTGVDVNTLQSIVMGVYGACDGSLTTSRDVMELVYAVANVPQSQRDKVFIDQLDMSAKDAVKLTPKEVAEEYVKVRAMRKVGATWWLRSDENKESLEESQRSTVTARVNSKLKALGGQDLNERYAEADGEWKQLRDMYESSRLRNNRPLVLKYHQLEKERKAMKQTANAWLQSETQEQMETAARQLVEQKKRYVEEWEDVRRQVKFTDGK